MPGGKYKETPVANSGKETDPEPTDIRGLRG